MERGKERRTVALVGNPNVGKSTLFNGLTGLNQHTGNWPGKTVSKAEGFCNTDTESYLIIDLPGTYSLAAYSPEEEVARDFICAGSAEVVIVVCEASCLERNLNLALQTMEICPNVILCINLIDEAEKKGVVVDFVKLSQRLQVPVIGTVAHQKQSIQRLLVLLDQVVKAPKEPREKRRQSVTQRIEDAEKIAAEVVTKKRGQIEDRDQRLDRIFTSKRTGYPIMIGLLALIFWITMVGANYPSLILSEILFQVQTAISDFFLWLHVPMWLHNMLVLGVFRVLSWVVSVMLPPMAIFFPLFTLLEDAGYLPRIAYNLDHVMKRCKACGKQSLTMCMGFGCNAVGVVGCRIIDSPRERLIAILTNSFVPCNGRFPAMIAIITMFFVGNAGERGISSLIAAFVLTAVIVIGVISTFIISRILSETILKGVPSSFTLELPSYRGPQIGNVLVRSVLDRTLFVLGRAIVIAAPAGAVIWVMANIKIGNLSLLNHCASFLDPLASLMGLDGMILMAFILGLPANEIVLPIVIMGYLSQGTMVDMENLATTKQLFIQNGWTLETAVSFLLFSLMHWPCSTTLLTIKKETGSIGWMVVGFILPMLAGFFSCFLVHIFFFVK